MVKTDLVRFSSDFIFKCFERSVTMEWEQELHMTFWRFTFHFGINKHKTNSPQWTAKGVFLCLLCYFLFVWQIVCIASPWSGLLKLLIHIKWYYWVIMLFHLTCLSMKKIGCSRQMLLFVNYNKTYLKKLKPESKHYFFVLYLSHS